MARYIFTNVGRGNVFRQLRAFLISLSVGRTFGRRGFVEIGESDGRIDEPKRLRITFPKRRWHRVFVGTHTPIVYPRFEDANVDRHYAAKGYSHGWPTKYWVEVFFKRDKVSLYNGHLPPGAFNAKKNERYEKERKVEWTRMWNKLTDMVESDQNLGRNSVVMCDANRQGDQPKPHKNAVLVAHHKTDYIWAVPAPGYRVLKGKSGSKELKIDFHKVIWADVKFGKK